MQWRAEAVGSLVARGDWVALGYLNARMDPYLVWHDVTGFRGAVLPGKSQMVVPVCDEYLHASQGRPKYKTNARTFDGLHKLVRDMSASQGPVERFEIGAPLVNEAQAQTTDPSANIPGGGANLDRRGQKPVVGFIDYGCGFAHRKLRRLATNAKDTRVLAIWDQSFGATQSAPPAPLLPLQWRLPRDFRYGRETHRDHQWHAEALTLGDYMAQFARHGEIDEEACYRHSGYEAVVGRHATHGMFLMDLATGHPSPLDRLLTASARPSGGPHAQDIVFVQLPRRMRGREVAGMLRANVYDAIRYIESCAPKHADVVINLSYGNYAGPHDGTTVVEEAIDSFIRRHQGQRRFELVLPAGNAAQAEMHARARIPADDEAMFHWHNLPDDPSDSFAEFWFDDANTLELAVKPPGGDWSTPVKAGQAITLGEGDPIAALIFVRQACQSRLRTMAMLAVGPTRTGLSGRTSAPYGRWAIRVTNRGTAPAEVDAWCEHDSPAFGTDGVPRQGHFSDTATSVVSQDGTLNGLAYGTLPRVAGGCYGDGTQVSYSSRDLGTGKAGYGAPATAALARPTWLALSDESAGQPGLAAAALIGTDTVRLQGTSIAAAVMTRALLNGVELPAPAAQNERDGPAPEAKPPPSNNAIAAAHGVVLAKLRLTGR